MKDRKLFSTTLGIVAVSVWIFCMPLTAQTPENSQLGEWWRERAPGARPYTVDAKKLPLISVQGNKFVDPDGKTMLFRGLSIADPDRIFSMGHWGKELFVKCQEMGAKVVRIPIHPAAWRGRTPAAYIELLDQAVAWCTELNMYIMLDWHSIGNLMTGVFENPMYDTSLQETYNFWRTMSRHYAGHNTIAFWELFNEPTSYRGQLGPVVWNEWKQICENEISLIRANNPQALCLVAGFEWAFDLTSIREAPINATNIGYTVHPYSNMRPQPWEAHWDYEFGQVAEKYPLIATEFGGTVEGAPDTYGPTIFRYLESKGISWVVWCFDPDWRPSLLKDWTYELTPSGEYAKKVMTGAVKP